MSSAKGHDPKLTAFHRSLLQTNRFEWITDLKFNLAKAVS